MTIDMTVVAEQVARYYHKYQFDRANYPYITHVERVVNRVIYCGDDVICVAWLHDLVEDTTITLDDLRKLGFNDTVIAGVDAMTQRENEPLESYWTRVHNNREAFIVKLHGDMPDNNNPERPGQKPHTMEKYAKAIDHFWKLGQVQQTPSPNTSYGFKPEWHTFADSE